MAHLQSGREGDVAATMCRGSPPERLNSTRHRFGGAEHLQTRQGCFLHLPLSSSLGKAIPLRVRLLQQTTPRSDPMHGHVSGSALALQKVRCARRG